MKSRLALLVLLPLLLGSAARAAEIDRIDATRGTARGWVVPLFRLVDEQQWGTTRWRTRRRHLFLTPGTSPMGFRLPLSSLAWAEAPDDIERSPLEMTGLLPIIVDGEAPAAVVQDIEDAPRTALCVEERDGLLHVSQIANERVNAVSDYLKEGQVVRVKVLETDEKGRVRLSMKALLNEKAE